MKDLITKDKIGDIYMISGFLEQRLFDDYRKGWRSNNELSCGGMTMDSGYRIIDLVEYLLGEGEVKKIHSFLSNCGLPNDAASAIVYNHNKTLVQIRVILGVPKSCEQEGIEIYGSKGYTKNRILSYIDHFFGENYIQQINRNRDIFVTIFRHGLAHQYFAKAAGISRNSGTLVTKDLGSGMLVLDADEFYVAFKASTSKLETVISNNSGGMSERITERYIKLVEGDKQKYQNRFNFPVTDTPVNTSISGMASLASLPNQQMSEQLKKAHQELIENPLMTSSEIDVDDL